MEKPSFVFVVTVNPYSVVVGCQKKRDLEHRGMFGFHSFSSCPDCKVISLGYQMWGSNGHLQAQLSNREQMCAWIKFKAKEQWPMRDGRTMGYRFQTGHTIYIQG
jgi:hypothetical protein